MADQTELSIPALLVKHMDTNALGEFYRRIKRTRRRYIPFGFNGVTHIIPRKEAQSLVAGEVETRTPV